MGITKATVDKYVEGKKVSLYLKEREVVRYIRQKVDDVKKFIDYEYKVITASKPYLNAMHQRLEDNPDIPVKDLLRYLPKKK